jgi:hypothetical protein
MLLMLMLLMLILLLLLLLLILLLLLLLCCCCPDPRRAARPGLRLPPPVWPRTAAAARCRGHSLRLPPRPRFRSCIAFHLRFCFRRCRCPLCVSV